MQFLKLIKELIEEHQNSTIVQKNGTILLAPGKIPKCKHMLFAPLNKDYLETHLITQYKNIFPSEYLYVLEHLNGANLYNVRLKTSDFSFSSSLFTIYGVPITSPFGRDIEIEEPFDLRIEDLSRHLDIPSTWLKCGRYIKDYQFGIGIDIFIDTKTNHVYACEKNKKEIVDSWGSLDECFCSIYQAFSDCKEEYELLV